MDRIAMLCVVAICVTSGIASKDINSMRIYIPNHITDEDAMISFTISDRIIQKFGNDIRPNVKNVLKNEGMMRGRRMIREKKEISPSQFISLVKNRYGILPPEETDEMSENRRIIKRIVNEEIRRMLYNKNRRR
jgi:citrate lyase gamma subunit